MQHVILILALFAVGSSAEGDGVLKRLLTQLALELEERSGPAFPVEKRLLDVTARGEDVVLDVVEEIQNSNIFPNDQGLMRRIAFLETRNGETATPASGGLWRVSKKAFEDTQNKGETMHKRLQAKKDLIQANWGLEWNNVEYRDLDSPFISGLAARIFMSNDPNPLPAEEELELQTRYWVNNYHEPVDVDEAVAALKRANKINTLLYMALKNTPLQRIWPYMYYSLIANVWGWPTEIVGS